MITGKEILLGFIIPVVLALAAWMAAAFAWRLNPEKPHRLMRAALIGLLPAGAYAFGFWGIHGWPGWVPLDTTHWFLHFAVIAGIVGMLSAVAGWLGWFSRLVLVVVFPWLLLKPIVPYEWTTQGIAIAWIAVFAGAMLLQMALLEHIGRNVGTPRFLLIVTTIVGLTALTLSMSGSIVLGKRSGILATILLAGFVVSYWLPKERFAVYLVPLITLVTGGLWLSAFYFAELSIVNAILLYSSVVLAWIGVWLRLERLPVWSGLIVHAALTLLPLAVAFALALSMFLSHTETSSYY